MEQFIGRKDELKKLEEFYKGSKYKACSILGRRRIGKTTLIEEFTRDKDHWDIQFLDSTLDMNLELLGITMSKYVGKKVRYDSTMDFFQDLAEYIKERKTIIVFDEFPYMVNCDKTFPSLTQYFVDKQIGKSKLILCGSSVKTMEYETNDYSRPLYGRTWRLDMDKMPIKDCMQFNPDLPDIEQLKMYLITGGIPLYCDVPDYKDFEDYVKRFILEPNSFFCREGESMIERELSPKWRYVAILDAMKGRRNTINTISSKTGIDRDTCTDCLNTMIELGLVSETRPMFGAPKKPKYYSIKDNMLAFHFLAKRMDSSLNTNVDEMLRAISPMISTERGFMFEEYCKELMMTSYPVRSIGTWWGNGPEIDRWGNVIEEKQSVEHDIDVAAEVASGFNVIELAVECKFSNNPVGFEALNQLNSSISCLKTKRAIRRMIISPSGFERELVEYAKENGILLVGLDMLLRKEPMPEL